jgi:beta-1,2-mannobiose phosphorylase / 1,2-beta-oligomannan phosphorylase
MSKLSYVLASLVFLVLPACRQKQHSETKSVNSIDFPKEMVDFVPYQHNPIFSGTNTEIWDKHIRERGFILVEDGIFKMWYTGYIGGDNDPKSLGYATSADGISWTRYQQNPIFSQKWTEDMFVIKEAGKYFMFAEGKNDVAHMLTSPDGINWEEQGDLQIRTVKGDTIHGPYGTPSVLIENGKWYLFYERNDEAVWLATSNDQKIWTNVQDEPVLKKGPETYDSGAVASNQIVKFKGKYYMYYHGSTDSGWAAPGATSIWTSNVAMSTDLIHWTKYPKNPIVEGDHSSPILVWDGNKYLLYTMHDKVWLYLPR